MAVQLGKYVKNGLSVNFIVYKLYQVKKKLLSVPLPHHHQKPLYLGNTKFLSLKKKKTKKTLLLKLYNSFG